MESKKSGYLIVIILGLLAIVLTGSDAWKTLKFRSIAVQTDGTVVGDRVSVGGKNTSYKYSVSYLSVKGKEDTAQVYTKTWYLKAGEKIQIYYDPSTPKWATLDIKVFNSFLGIVIGLLLLLWGFPSYRNEVKKEKSRTQSGQ